MQTRDHTVIYLDCGSKIANLAASNILDDFLSKIIELDNLPGELFHSSNCRVLVSVYKQSKEQLYKEFLDLRGKLVLIASGDAARNTNLAFLLCSGCSLVSTHSETNHLYSAVTSAIEGGTYMCNLSLEIIKQRIYPAKSPFDDFNHWELKVLSCVIKGYTNARIVKELGSSKSIVDSTLGNIFTHLGVNNRSVVAFQAGVHGFKPII